MVGDPIPLTKRSYRYRPTESVGPHTLERWGIQNQTDLVEGARKAFEVEILTTLHVRNNFGRVVGPRLGEHNNRPDLRACLMEPVNRPIGHLWSIGTKEDYAADFGLGIGSVRLNACLPFAVT